MKHLYIILLCVVVLFLIVKLDKNKLKQLFNRSNQETDDNSIRKREKTNDDSIEKEAGKVKKEYGFIEKGKLFNYRLHQYLWHHLIGEIILFVFGVFFLILSILPVVSEAESSWWASYMCFLIGIYFTYTRGLTLLNRIKQEKIDDYKRKKEYLNLKFKNLIKTKCVKNGKKIFDISITKPVKKEGEWLVHSVTLDYEGDPDYEEVYVITDSKLNKLIN